MGCDPPHLSRARRLVGWRNLTLVSYNSPQRIAIPAPLGHGNFFCRQLEVAQAGKAI